MEEIKPSVIPLAKALEELRAEYAGIDKAINSEEFAQFPLEQQELLKSHADQFKTDLDSVIEQSKEGKNVLSELAKIHDRNTSFGETLRGMYEAPAAPEPTAEQAEVAPTEPEQAVPEPEATPQPQYRPLQDEDESPLGVYTKRDELQPDANFFEPEDGGSPALVRMQGFEDLYEVITYDPNERTIQTLGEDGELYETSLDEEGVD